MKFKTVPRLARSALRASICCAGCAVAQEQDLTQLDLATLMQMDVEVTTVSKSAQSIYEVPAPIYVIPTEALRNSGVTSIPEALQLVPGVIVGQLDQTKWAVGMRGFAWQYNNKVLFLLDGRAIYTPLNSSVYWEALDVPMEDIERIEVIRGPGDARWGSHAVNGIVNIITRSSADTQGALLTVSLDTNSGYMTGARYGGQFSENTHYRAYARYIQRGDFAATGSAPRVGNFYTTRTGVRIDSQYDSGDKLTFIGDVEQARIGTTLPVTHALARYNPTAWNLLGRWERGRPGAISQQAQLSFDYMDQMPPYERNHSIDFAYQVQFPRKWAQDWTLGVNYRNTSDQISESLSIVPDRMTQNIYGAFAHNRVALGNDTDLLVSAQFEHNPFTGWEAQPSLQLLYRPQEKRSYWFSVGRAVRTPLRIDDGFNLDLPAFPGGVGRLLGNRDLESENVTSTQAGMRTAIGEGTYIDVALFYNDYQDLVSQVAETPFFEPLPPPGLTVFPIRYANAAYGHTRGAELSFKTQISARWGVVASYSLYDESLGGAPAQFGEFTAIEHQVQLHSSAQLLPALFWKIDLYYVGALTSGVVGDYYKLNSQLSWKPKQGLQLILGIKDALSPRRRQVGDNSVDVPTLVPRRGYVQASWQF